MDGDEILRRLEERLAKGEISEETYREIRGRYPEGEPKKKRAPSSGRKVASRRGGRAVRWEVRALRMVVGVVLVVAGVLWLMALTGVEPFASVHAGVTSGLAPVIAVLVMIVLVMISFGLFVGGIALLHSSMRRSRGASTWRVTAGGICLLGSMMLFLHALGVSPFDWRLLLAGTVTILGLGLTFSGVRSRTAGWRWWEERWWDRDWL